MTIELEAISFNHDPASAARDALTIRKNEAEDLTVPEWTRGMTRPEDSRAAYITDQIAANCVTIKVQFSRQDGDPTSVEVYAVGDVGNVLGNVKRRTITFQNNSSAVEIFELDSPSGNPGVKVSDIGWNWFVDGRFVKTTEHRIYTVLKEPQAPWGQPGSSFPGFQLPWTEVLEHACRAADGALTVNEAAAMLTRWIYSLGRNKLGYNDYGSGASSFTIGGMKTFKCTAFLRFLAAGLATTAKVNCTDCATILSSFANILGCDLVQSRIGGAEFETNRIQKIGSATTTKQEFKFHEVAWKFPARGAASIYDCCLQLDGDADPTGGSFSPTLGINMPLGVPGSSGYHFRLIAPNGHNRSLGELSRTRVRRKIDGRTATRITLDPEQRRRLEKEYDFPEWQGTPKQVCKPSQNGYAVSSEVTSKSEQQLFLKNYSWHKAPQALAGWTPGDVQWFEAEPDPLRLTDVVWRSDGCSGAELRVLTYECSSVPAARSFLLTLLAEFNLRGINRRREFVAGCEQVKIGDVAFAGPDEFVLLFARANNVILIQNVGRSFLPVAQFAHAMDSDMTSSPDPQAGQLCETSEFQVCDPQIRVGDEVLIHTGKEPITSENETLYKFFAPAGEVFLEGNYLRYRCQAAGEQSVTILAHKAGGETTRQVLNLFAEAPVVMSKSCCCNDLVPSEGSDMDLILGTWSSIRPTNNGDDSSADMTVEGYINITDRNSETGAVTGVYWDSGTPSSMRPVSGSVILTAAGAFTMDLYHQVTEDVTRHYEGRLVASDGAEDFGVQIVAGTYSNLSDEDSAPLRPFDPAPSFDASRGGQENGTWVATKP